jgi:hypothetical protein
MASRITVADARHIARTHAIEALRGAMSPGDDDPLAAEHLEAEHCWMFFRRDDILRPADIPAWALWAGDRSYCVSKHGDIRFTYDLRQDPEKAAEHLAHMSRYFGGRVTTG